MNYKAHLCCNQYAKKAVERCILIVTKVWFVIRIVLCLAIMLASFVCLTYLIRLIDPMFLGEMLLRWWWWGLSVLCSMPWLLCQIFSAVWGRSLLVQTWNHGYWWAVECKCIGRCAVSYSTYGGIHVHFVSSVCMILYLYTCTPIETLVCKRMYHKLQFSESIRGLSGSWIFQPIMLLYHRNAGMHMRRHEC